MSDCPACGEPHPPHCETDVATRIADHIAEHPEDLNLALMERQVVHLTARLEQLETQVHQHY